MTGVVEPRTGSLTGDNIAFLYPDLTTALLGTFRDGVAERVSPARLVSVRTEGGSSSINMMKIIITMMMMMMTMTMITEQIRNQG